MTPKVYAALMGGLVIGVLSALPLVNALNFCCCLWVLAGGVLTAYILQANQPGAITPGDGATAGLLAGIVGALVEVALAIPIAVVVGPFQDRIFQAFVGAVDWGSTGLGVPTGAGSLSGRLIRLAISFPIILVMRMVFATLGGTIGAVIFQRSPVPPPQPAPGTTDVLPPE